MDERLVINTGPVIALGRVGALPLLQQIGLRVSTPPQVAAELESGVRLGYPVALPEWIEVVALRSPLAPLTAQVLDAGEAAVIQLALEQNVDTVAIDEARGRRAAAAVGLKVTGSLGILGRAKQRGLIDRIPPWTAKLSAAGVRYHPELLERFLASLGE